MQLLLNQRPLFSGASLLHIRRTLGVQLHGPLYRTAEPGVQLNLLGAWEALKVLKIAVKASPVGHPAVVSTFTPDLLLPWLPVLRVKKILLGVQKL